MKMILILGELDMYVVINSEYLIFKDPEYRSNYQYFISEDFRLADMKHGCFWRSIYEAGRKNLDRRRERKHER